MNNNGESTDYIITVIVNMKWVNIKYHTILNHLLKNYIVLLKYMLYG